MSLRKQAVSGMVWTFAQQFSTRGIGFVVSVILARVLLPAEFGIIGMIGIFMGIGAVLINSGLTTSLIRTPDADQEDFSTVFYFNLAGSIIFYTLLFIAAPYIADFFKQPILTNLTRVLGITFIISAFSSVHLTRLTQKLDFKTQMKIVVPSLIGGGILGIALAYSGYGVWSLVWMAVCQAFLDALQLWIVTKWRPSWVFNVEKFKHHFYFGYKILLSGLLDTIFINSYTVIIGKFFNLAQLGYFTRANSVVQLPVENISLTLNKVTYPLFAAIQDDDERLKGAYQKILKMVIFLIAPTLVIMGVLATPLFRFVFTDKWLPAVPYFQIICISGVLYPFHLYNLNILNVKGRSDLYLKLEIIKKVLTIVTIFLSFPFGMYGLLWGIVISSAITLFINMHYSGKFIHYNAFEQLRDVFPALSISIITGVITIGVDQGLMYYHLGDFLRLVIGSIAGCISFISMAALFKLSTIQDIKTIILRK